jgi:protein-L-isoaspartate(D-aspartate) O-methyltransferase
MTAMTIHAPVPDFTAARRTMIESQLRPQGVTDPGVLEAMHAVPRERFVPGQASPIAYSDRAIPLGFGRAMTPPAALGQLLTQMAPTQGDTALVVGAGTGYSSAVLSHMGLQVTAVESETALADVARGHGLNVVAGDLARGCESAAPFDIILIDGAVESIPEDIIAQLAEGGRLGAALIERGVTRLIVGRRTRGAFGYLSIADAAIPVLPGFSRPQAFTF